MYMKPEGGGGGGKRNGRRAAHEESEGEGAAPWSSSLSDHPAHRFLGRARNQWREKRRYEDGKSCHWGGGGG